MNVYENINVLVIRTLRNILICPLHLLHYIELGELRRISKESKASQ